MKKLIVMLVMICFVKNVYALSGDMFSTGANEELRIDSSGVIISSPGGVITAHETFIDLAASATDFYRLVTVTLATATFVSGGTTWLLASTDYSNSPHGRNITIKADFSTGIATAAVTGSGVITGTNMRGSADSETIVFSTVATLGVGVEAWQSITSIALTGTVSSAATAIGFAVGTGNVIGLVNNIVKAADIRKVIEAGSLVTTHTANAAYDTIDFATDGNGSRDYEVFYNVISR